MTDLFWPGDHRAGDLMSDHAFLNAMVAVEQAWLDALIEAGIAPDQARAYLAEHLTDSDHEPIARGAMSMAARSADLSRCCERARSSQPHDGCIVV